MRLYCDFIKNKQKSDRKRRWVELEEFTPSDPHTDPGVFGFIRRTTKLCGKSYVDFFFDLSFFQFVSILAGGRCPPDRPGFGWGGKASSDSPTKRSYLAFDRGGQAGPPQSNSFVCGAVRSSLAFDRGGQTGPPQSIKRFFFRRC